MIFDQSYMLNLYTLVLLLILFFTMTLKKETYRYSSRLLRTVIVLISIQLIIEILSWSFDTINEPYARVLNYTFNFVFFVFGPVIIGMFFSYVDYLIFKSKERLRRRLYYMHLLILFIILAIINIFTPILFSLSNQNVYQREALMNLAFIAVFVKLLYILYMTWTHRDRLEKSVLLSIFVFSTIPIIGALLQMFFFGLLIMWAFVGLSVVIAYIFTETYNSSKDYLTKLYTREIAEEFIFQLIDSKNEAMVILFDIDNLKLFNDRFGHKEGDQVLVSFANALNEAFPQDSLVARFGGDEFLTVINDNHENQFKDYLNHLSHIISDYQVESFSLRFSYGIASTKDPNIVDLKSLINTCDKAMYEQKAKHKEIK